MMNDNVKKVLENSMWDLAIFEWKAKCCFSGI